MHNTHIHVIIYLHTCNNNLAICTTNWTHQHLRIQAACRQPVHIRIPSSNHTLCPTLPLCRSLPDLPCLCHLAISHLLLYTVQKLLQKRTKNYIECFINHYRQLYTWLVATNKSLLWLEFAVAFLMKVVLAEVGTTGSIYGGAIATSVTNRSSAMR